MKFEHALAKFRDDKIGELAASAEGLRFLKLKSLSRKEHLQQLFNLTSHEPVSSGIRAMFEEAYNTPSITDAEIDRAIKSIYENERSGRKKTEDKLVSELYRLNTFDWGGLHQNSLEKTIVDNYIKKISRGGLFFRPFALK